MAQKPTGNPPSSSPSGHPDTPHGHGRPLWAPWRMAFIGGPKRDGCFLCEKGAPEAAGDPANLIVARGATAYVLLNAYPYNSGHLLIAPYRHVADLTDLTPEELAELMDLTVKAEKAMVRAMRPQGFNFGFNLGAAAGAGVPGHVHGHLVPRWVGDTNFMPVLGNTRVVPQALEDTADLLRRHWQS